MSKFDKSKIKIQSIIAKKTYNERINPKTKNSIYPWNNHDFDYQQVVRNSYNPEKLGISDEPCLDVTINDGLNIAKYGDVLMSQAIPDSNSKSGVNDLNNSNNVIKLYKNKYDSFPEPYPGFKDEYPDYFPNKISGEHSSSYFIKTGDCPINSIKDKKTCESKKYNWTENPIKIPPLAEKFFEIPKNAIPGGCTKPRYTYIDNSSGGPEGLLKGIVPTLGK